MATQSIEMEIISRAWKDAEFKNRFISDPKSVLEEYGQRVPQDLHIQVIAEDSDTRYFVLPTDPTASLDDVLLSESELDAVAGGAEASPEWCSVLGCSTQTRNAEF